MSHMKIEIHKFVLDCLTAYGRSRWDEVAEGSGVPLSTVKKIAYKETENPGVTNVEALANWFLEQGAGTVSKASSPTLISPSIQQS